ncbi:MAG: DUF924 family protein [Polyangiales bacterium]
MDAASILDYWLGPEAMRDEPARLIQQRWFDKSAETDAFITRELGANVLRAAGVELDAWAATARGRLALVILLDQLTRNIHRGSGRMFDHDAKAVALTKSGLELGHDRELRAAERQFLYMPLMHSEQLADQKQSVALFEALARDAPKMDARKWARRHMEIVERFGRFPHRNTLLGRTSTAEEIEFLTQPGSAF